MLALNLIHVSKRGLCWFVDDDDDIMDIGHNLLLIQT